jgi:hypothetical protein
MHEVDEKSISGLQGVVRSVIPPGTALPCSISMVLLRPASGPILIVFFGDEEQWHRGGLA